MSSTIGHIFQLTTFGESHGKAIGGIIEGCPSGIELDLNAIQLELDRRKPGQSDITTPRKESDQVEFLSGLIDGTTTGAPIGFTIPNTNTKSEDYDHLKDTFRPSHADYSYDKKYGVRDHRGGGRASARETANWVVAGAIAKQILGKKNVKITAYVDQVGSIKLEGDIDFEVIDKNEVRTANLEVATRMNDLIDTIRDEGNTIGGSIACNIIGVPAGLGEPVFAKLSASLGKAMLSINAVKGFEIGSGFSAVAMKGSEHNDLFNEDFSTKSNHSGGIQGGISNGMPINFRVAFKPVSTVMQHQPSVDSDGAEITLEGKGRHDPCVVPRAVAIVEALSAIVLLDAYLTAKTNTI